MGWSGAQRPEAFSAGARRERSGSISPPLLAETNQPPMVDSRCNCGGGAWYGQGSVDNRVVGDAGLLHREVLAQSNRGLCPSDEPKEGRVRCCSDGTNRYSLGVVREQNAHLGEVRGGRARRSMQAMPRIVEADRRCHHASGDAQMGRLFPDAALAGDHGLEASVRFAPSQRASNTV